MSESRESKTALRAPIKKKPLSAMNLVVGGAIQMFEVSTLGQPFEVIKTHMAANRNESLPSALRSIHSRGGLSGFWTGLIPWAWIEASTKGAILLFASSEIEHHALRYGFSSSAAGTFGGMVGGVAQAYTTMGFCTCLKTIEVTRHKATSGANLSTWQIFGDIWRREGIRGINRGVTAVALRQMTNWGSRFGISRVTESIFKQGDQNRKLSLYEKLSASIIGGSLACWNQPIEVIRVEMQSKKVDPNRPPNMNIVTAAKYIYKSNGLLGFYRGVTPRIGLSVYLTVCMVFGGDQIKAWIANK